MPVAHLNKQLKWNLGGSMSNTQGKVVITEASGGLGEATARCLTQGRYENEKAQTRNKRA